jgi:hypothetical protein
MTGGGSTGGGAVVVAKSRPAGGYTEAGEPHTYI